jgi:Zn-finger nucleic acid-binding protein
MHLKPDEDSYKCDFCHSVFLPEKDDDGVRVLGDPSGQACPVCNIPLVDAAIAKIRILYCTKCRGMLIPMQVFQTLIDELQAVQGGTVAQPAADSGDLLRKIECPQCHHHMDTHFYAGPGNVVIDSCEQCSLTWLDRGELMHIVHAPGMRTEATSFDTVPDVDDDTAA